jgi:hypothetical protein
VRNVVVEQIFDDDATFGLDAFVGVSYSSCKGYPAFTFVSWETPARVSTNSSVTSMGRANWIWADRSNR